MYNTVFNLRVLRHKSAYGQKAKTAVALYLGNHRAKRIKMRRKHKRIALTAERDEHAALVCELRFETESFKFALNIFRRRARKTRRARNRHKLFKSVYHIFHGIISPCL